MKVGITGASSGLGQALARTFLSKGDEVVALCRNVPQDNMSHISTNFTDEKSITNAVHSILTEHNDISCLICCAGIGYIEDIDQTNYHHTEEMFQVNLVGQSYLLSGLAPLIKKNNIDIIFIGATIGFKANEYMPMYSVTKWGLRGLVENWRNYLKNSGSRVMHFSPGSMDTESNCGPTGRDTCIAQKTGKGSTSFLDVKKVAEFIVSCLALPRNMEIAEVIINRN